MSGCRRCREPCHLATKPSWRTLETPSCSHWWPTIRLARVSRAGLHQGDGHSGRHGRNWPHRNARRLPSLRRSTGWAVNAAAPRSSLSAAARLVPDLKNPNFGEVAKAMDSGRTASRSRRARGVRSDLAHEPSPALLRVEVKPMQLVALPSPFVSAGDGGRHSGLHSQGNPARQGRRRLGNDGREHPLIEGDRKTGVSQGERQCLTRQSHWLSSQLFFWAWSRAAGWRSS